ncbi:GntR family transcriptional regulator [Actinomadura terrae]|uniref:GntR family transcriptional regulator n=1 Tax=Actinomadura terrae TaxID=604353 RepID=UPI001FA7C3BE|nr:GntR family transcriptional regulator [Actinomadura terrae]
MPTARRTAWGAYRRITDALRQRVTDGTYAPGTRIPAEAALCAEFGVSRNTVRRALSVLQDEDLVKIRPGVGRFVHDPTTDPTAQTLPRYLSIAADLRHQITTGHLAPGDMLPSEAQLKKRYGVARYTARRALRSLEEADLITCVHGKGRYVRQDVPR